MKKKSCYKIIIKGGFGLSNFGDDALMLAVYDIANKIYNPNDIGFICKNAHYISRLIPGSNIVQMKSHETIASNIFLTGGGTQFYSFPLTYVAPRRASTSGASGRTIAICKKAIKRPDKLVRKIYRMLFPMPLKTEPDKYNYLAAIGIGAGPFVKNSIPEKTAECLLKKMHHVAVRDIKSYKLCQKWGVKDLSHCADLCFLPEFRNKYVFSKCGENKTNIKRIAIIVRDWPHDTKRGAYDSSLFEVFNSLSIAGYLVEFVLFAMDRDKIWLKKLKNRNINYVLWNPKIDSIAAFTKKLSEYDLFITARYHGAVFASLLGKPSVCIGIEQKLEMIAELLGKGGRLWQYPYDVEECLNAIHDIDQKYSKSVEAVDLVAKQQGVLSKKMVDDFIVFCKQCD